MIYLKIYLFLSYCLMSYCILDFKYQFKNNPDFQNTITHYFPETDKMNIYLFGAFILAPVYAIPLLYFWLRYGGK